ncbi:MAG: ABC transporter ATP-binding protein [Chloroflexi bacterium]|nr:ABC transporter ATP-binding protein [Chloroflexota bacterium]
MAGATVTATEVSRKFHLGSEDVWAVRDVSLTVAPGEMLALVGRSGSGKTTLMNILAGLDRPTSGEVVIDGERVDTMSEKELTELRRHKLGFVFQSFGLLPLLSAHENVELPLRIAGYRHGERVKRAKRALDIVGLTRRSDHRPYELSGGEQQRVAIARAIATEPSLILADEPTGELDSSTALAVFSLLRELARTEGITVITCTHDRLVMEMADRVEELADGHLTSGHDRQVWEFVQAKERSVFAPALPPRLEPAAKAHFAAANTLSAAPAAISKDAERADEIGSPNGRVEEHAPESDEISRWAPPPRRD